MNGPMAEGKFVKEKCLRLLVVHSLGVQWQAGSLLRSKSAFTESEITRVCFNTLKSRGGPEATACELTQWNFSYCHHRQLWHGIARAHSSFGLAESTRQNIINDANWKPPQTGRHHEVGVGIAKVPELGGDAVRCLKGWGREKGM